MMQHVDYKSRRRTFAAAVGALLIPGALLSGCGSVSLRNASPEEIAIKTSKIAVAGRSGIEFQAPLLTQDHWQVEMGGEDELSYRLSGYLDAGSENISHRMDVDSEYRARNPAGYIEVRFADGTVRPVVQLRHETERCQEFNAMQSGCTFRDHFNFSLSLAELTAMAQGGLQARLIGKAGDLQKIELPASYIQGYLKAVNAK